MDIQNLKELKEVLWIVLCEINSESKNSISKLIFAKFIEYLIINIIMIAIITVKNPCLTLYQWWDLS